MNAIRVLLADDHALVRAGFRSLLKKIRPARIVAEARDGREALELVRQHQPDLVLMDIAMPRLNGLEALVRVRKEFPNTKVIILSMHESQEYILRALRAGASGYLIKNATVGELEQAIRAVIKGKSFFSPQISKQAIENYLARAKGIHEPLKRLTSRQREVMQLIAEGNNTKEVAFLLELSVKTVEAHRTQLMRRLGIRDMPSLVRSAMRAGLVPLERVEAGKF